jgi:hypothetical protein
VVVAFVVGMLLAGGMGALAQQPAAPDPELLQTALQQLFASRNNVEFQLIACRAELDKLKMSTRPAKP